MATEVATKVIEMTKYKVDGENAVVYVPFGEIEPIELTMALVKSRLVTPTKSGKMPSETQIIAFMQLCKARELNPWVGDAYLVGYDSNNGPQFSLITAQQSLFKRAEKSQVFDGIRSGVIVTVKGGGVPMFREGDLLLSGEVLIGGWARVFRKDREQDYYDALNLDVYNTKQSRWAKDPAGMIVKCAESSCLRKAFPSQVGGLYTRDEMDHVTGGAEGPRQQQPRGLRSVASLAALTDVTHTPAQEPQHEATEEPEPATEPIDAESAPVEEPPSRTKEEDDSALLFHEMAMRDCTTVAAIEAAYEKGLAALQFDLNRELLKRIKIECEAKLKSSK
jgi:phage recombination protein Bet